MDTLQQYCLQVIRTLQQFTAPREMLRKIMVVSEWDLEVRGPYPDYEDFVISLLTSSEEDAVAALVDKHLEWESRAQHISEARLQKVDEMKRHLQRIDPDMDLDMIMQLGDRYLQFLQDPELLGAWESIKPTLAQIINGSKTGGRLSGKS